MEIRADSICRFVTYAGETACRPYSPNASSVPPLAMPRRLGWCCLRCLTLRGISMGSGLRSSVVRGGSLGRSLVHRGRSLGAGTTTTATALATGGTLAPTGTLARATRTRRTVAGLGGGVVGTDLSDVLDVALVDPDLDADTAEGGLGLEEAVVHVGAQGVQGHTAL